MNKLLNYKTKTKNATPLIFTEIVALFFFTNCQRWDYNSDWYYACEEMKKLFQETANELSEEYGAEQVDFAYVEKHTRR